MGEPETRRRCTALHIANPPDLNRFDTRLLPLNPYLRFQSSGAARDASAPEYDRGRAFRGGRGKSGTPKRPRHGRSFAGGTNSYGNLVHPCFSNLNFPRTYRIGVPSRARTSPVLPCKRHRVLPGASDHYARRFVTVGP